MNLNAQKSTANSRLKLGGDVVLIALVIGLSLFGVVMVYSASSFVAENDYDNAYYYAQKQFIGFLLGLVAMLFTANFDYYKYLKKSWWLCLASMVLLGAVFIPKLGIEVYGAKRWLNLGFFTIQPSELAKFCYVFWLAQYFSKDMTRATTFKGILLPLGVGVAICLLIMLEPNMSITMCVALVMLIVLFSAGVRVKHFLLILIPFIVAVPVLIVLEPYRLRRLTAFLNPWENPKGEGYQLLQSLYGLASGGWFGVGLFNSRQKYRFLPFSESDFILSIIGEELGFVGTLLLFTAMFLVIARGVRIASRAKDFFSYLLSVGVISVYAVQVMINALVVTGLIPPTGLPLPLISAGNTSLIVFMAGFGVLYNISTKSQTVELKKPITYSKRPRKNKVNNNPKGFGIQ